MRAELHGVFGRRGRRLFDGGLRRPGRVWAGCDSDPRGPTSWGCLDPIVRAARFGLGSSVSDRDAVCGKWALGLTSPNLQNQRASRYSPRVPTATMMDVTSDSPAHGQNYMRLNRCKRSHPQDTPRICSRDWADRFCSTASRERSSFLYLAYNARTFRFNRASRVFAEVQPTHCPETR